VTMTTKTVLRLVRFCVKLFKADERQSRAILEKAERSKKGIHDEDHDEDDGIDRGPSLCSVDQSAITGESLASEKFIGDIAYYTCGVKRGKCYGVVTCPAPESFVGRTAALVTGALSSHRTCMY